MAEVELVGIPFDGYGRVGHQDDAARVLREAGLVAALAPHPVVDHGDLALPAGDGRRGPDTSLVNEAALAALVDAVGAQVVGAVGAGRFPVVVGGDCTTLLGTVPALRDHLGPVGLVFLDGHEDTMPLDVSEDGEAANTEIGLLLGLTGRLLRGPLAARLPALGADALAVLGVRDVAWRSRFNVGSLREAGVWLRDHEEVADDAAGLAADAVRHVRTTCDRWWLHVDLDVLDPEVFAAQGVPGSADEPGGLTWVQLATALAAALDQGGCLGWSVAIYDPAQDPDREDAARIVDLVRAVAPAIA